MGSHWAQSTLRKNVIAIFMVIMGLSILFSGFVIYQQWIEYVEDVKGELTRDASVTTSLVQAKLIDATKVLDIGKQRLDAVFADGSVSERKVYEQLQETIGSFRTFNPTQMLGRLFFVDESGKLFAQSDVYPSPRTDLSDRYYFRELSKAKHPAVIIADMVKSRLRNDLVFDAVIRIDDSDGNLRGVLCQHVVVSRVTDELKHVIETKNGNVYTYTADGHLIFAYPYQVAEVEVDHPIHGLELSYQNLAEQGFVEGELAGVRSTQYIGYATGNKFPIVSTEVVSKSSVVSRFLAQNWQIFCLMLFSAVVVGGLFWRLLCVVANFEEAQKIALRDKLTELGNRRLMDEVFPKMWRDALRNKTPISILFVDIDHFKMVNDDHGHEAGDCVLAQVARVLSDHARRPMDLCCRWGGEEFVCVLPNTSADNAVMLAESILREVQALKMEWKNQSLPTVTVSIGIASTVVTDENFTDDLIDMADKAMLTAKHSGRNCYWLSV